MSYIATQPPDADPRLKRMYDRIMKEAGYWPNLYHVMSLRPELLEPVEEFRRGWHDHLFHGTPWQGGGESPAVPGGVEASK